MRPEGPTESYQRYGDRGSEDVNRQVPGGGGRNGKVISISLLNSVHKCVASCYIVRPEVGR